MAIVISVITHADWIQLVDESSLFFWGFSISVPVAFLQRHSIRYVGIGQKFRHKTTRRQTLSWEQSNCEEPSHICVSNGDFAEHEQPDIMEVQFHLRDGFSRFLRCSLAMKTI